MKTKKVVVMCFLKVNFLDLYNVGVHDKFNNKKIKSVYPLLRILKSAECSFVVLVSKIIEKKIKKRIYI